MLGKLTDILKNEPFYVPNILFKNYKKLNITDSELIILIYLINSNNTFNPKQIAKELNFKLNEIMDLIESSISLI